LITSEMLRRLRIAVSVVSLVACVLVIGLWVRSYWWQESLLRAPTVSNKLIVLTSHGGKIIVGPYRAGTQLLSKPDTKLVGKYPWRSKPLAGRRSDEASKKSMPHWCLAIACTVAATTPWWPWSTRFSLRTLLVATTSVALALWVIIYYTRG